MTLNQVDASRPSRAMRSARRRWLDIRLLVGVLLAGGGAAVAWVMWPSNAAETTTALVAARDLPEGMVIGTQDLVHVAVQVPASTSAVLAPSGIGRQLARNVQAGSLLTTSDLRRDSGGASGVRHVSISVEPGHAPPSASRGDVVEVWATPDSAFATGPSRMVARVVIADVADSDSTLGDRVFVVQVSARQSAQLVSALHNHGIDLVEVAQ